jgi:hypothetical protein
MGSINLTTLVLETKIPTMSVSTAITHRSSRETCQALITSGGGKGAGKRPSTAKRIQPLGLCSVRAPRGQLSMVRAAQAAEEAERKQTIIVANRQAYFERRDRRQQYARKRLPKNTNHRTAQKPAWMIIRDTQIEAAAHNGAFDALYSSDEEEEKETSDVNLAITGFPALNGTSISASTKLSGSWAQRSQKHIPPRTTITDHEAALQAAGDDPEQIAKLLEQPPPPPAGHKRSRKCDNKGKALKLPPQQVLHEVLDFSIMGSKFNTGQNWGDYDSDDDSDDN